MPWITKDGRPIFIGEKGATQVNTRGGTFQPTSTTKAYGAPSEGKAGFNGHSTTSVIRAAAQHGLDREQTKQLLTRMNLTAAPNTVYIQHARGKAGEQVPVMAPHHEAEFLSHVAAIKGRGSIVQPEVTVKTSNSNMGKWEKGVGGFEHRYTSTDGKIFTALRNGGYYQIKYQGSLVKTPDLITSPDSAKQFLEQNHHTLEPYQSGAFGYKMGGK